MLALTSKIVSMMNGSLFFWRLSCGVVSKPKGVFYYHVKNTYNTHRQRKWVLSYACEGSMYAWYSSDTNYQHNEAQRSTAQSWWSRIRVCARALNVKYKKNDTTALGKMFSIFSIFFTLIFVFCFVKLCSILCGVGGAWNGIRRLLPERSAWTSRFVLLLLFVFCFCFFLFRVWSFFILTLAPYHYVCRSFGYSRGDVIYRYICLHRIRIGPTMLLIISSAGKKIGVSLYVCAVCVEWCKRIGEEE